MRRASLSKVLAQNDSDMLESFGRLEVSVVTRRGVMDGRREEGKGEGPRDCSLVVSVDQAEMISLRTLNFGFE